MVTQLLPLKSPLRCTCMLLLPARARKAALAEEYHPVLATPVYLLWLTSTFHWCLSPSFGPMVANETRRQFLYLNVFVKGNVLLFSQSNLPPSITYIIKCVGPPKAYVQEWRCSLFYCISFFRRSSSPDQRVYTDSRDRQWLFCSL